MARHGHGASSCLVLLVLAIICLIGYSTCEGAALIDGTKADSSAPAPAELSVDAENEVIDGGTGTKESRTQRSNFGAIIGLFKEVIARSASTSEVLTLNLTNLLILLVLKGILIALGVAGGLGFGLLGRSAVAPTKPYFTTDDLRWGATYLISSQDRDYTCLNTLACLDPENASDYLTGCKLMLKGAKVASGVLPRLFPYNEKYEVICKGIKDAAFYSGDCNRKYKCGVDLYKR